ncbi:MAG TPA: precorrin-3B synthase [Acidimicrobiia bacterium]
MPRTLDDPAPSNVRGECPSVHAPFVELDGALLRVRLPGGAVSVAAARTIADVVAAVGGGPIELTNRANLQLRGIPLESVAIVREELVAAGVTDRDPEADGRRNVLTSPTAGVDPGELADTGALVAAVADRLTAPAAAGLSAKFGVLVDGGGEVHVRGRAHDLAVGAVRGRDGAVRYEVCLAGALPLTHAPDELVWLVDPPSVLDVVDAAIAMCARFGRARDLLDTVGPDRVWTDLSRRAHDGLRPHRGDVVLDGRGATQVPVGVRPQRRPGRVMVGAVPVLGRLDAATLRTLADVADRVGPGELRISPWRGVVLTDVAETDAASVVAAWTRAGLVCDPAHPANLDVACAGNQGCAAGRVDTQADARRLIERLRELPVDRRPRSVHVSGCEKGCARPQPTACSLVAGTAPGTYDLHVDRPGATDRRFGDRVQSALDPDTAIDAVLAAGLVR